MPRALITGITGQDGLYLAELLLAKGYEVYGLIRGQNNPKRELVERERARRQAAHRRPDRPVQPDPGAARPPQPDEVYNLGAISFVAYSWENARLTTRRHRHGRAQHARGDPALRRRRHRRGALLPGVQLGDVRQGAGGAADARRTLLWPRSPYGVAKVFGHYMTINYRESYGMHASSGILFNHESPRRGPEFVTRKISQAVARISLGLQDERLAGQPRRQARLGLRRRLRRRDVADAAAADEADDYVVATGETHSIRELPRHRVRAASASTTGSSYVVQDPRFFRPAEVDLLIGDADQGPRAARLEAHGRFPRAGRR